MRVEKINLHVSQLLSDLDSSLTWLKSEDLGFGSIQQKYGASDRQIEAIRRHPKLRDVQPRILTFNIIDDTAEVAKEQKTPPVLDASHTPADAATRVAYESFNLL